ncbi:MAG: long-chain-fatty-acid--CoA ligase [Ilumatobacteraceae bacterium]|nr:long-chain-fatty-acid--CoA ligase [Ilumatobacteraceae bacterium]
MMPTTLADIIRAGAASHPDRVAIAADERSVTYVGLHERSNRAAGVLAGLGIGRGDRVAFLSMNRIEYYELMFGAAKLGAATVPVNWRLAPGEVAGILSDAQPELLLVEHDLLHLVGDAHTERLGDRLLTVGSGDDGPRDWGTLVDAGPDVDPNADVAPDDVMWQLYTSGTTGKPKGVMLMHRNLIDMIDGLADQWHFEPGCVVYVPYPSFHAVGTAWPVITMHRGGTVLLRRSFDPVDFVRKVESERVTLTMMVPAVLNMVLSEPEARERDLSSLRHIVYGASPISQAVLNTSIELMPGCAFHHAYGLTECTGTVTTMQWDEHRPGTERMKSCGRPMPWVEMKVVDPSTGDEVEPRTVGEVWTRSPSVMKGYYDAPEATAAAVSDGWLHTGDAGFLDEDGYLYLTDRVTDMIISGGENIYPAEVENVLYSHPDIREAAVVGIPDDRWGEVVFAVVVTSDDSGLEPDAVIAYCREHLGRYKCPSRVVVRSEPLPLNPTGKVLRRELRTQYIDPSSGGN